MKVFGLSICHDHTSLVDCETGEILAENSNAIHHYLEAHDGEYVLTII